MGRSAKAIAAGAGMAAGEPTRDTDRKAKAIFVPVAEILEPLEAFEADIAADLKELRGML